MPKISIIVPVYRTEDYLARCIESILAQTFADFELILVDDGSPDNSGAICDEYAKKDNRIRVIHQQNKGASAARNCGIRKAVGEYLMFCDSDDVVSPMWVERLVSLADKNTLPMGAYCSNIEQLGTEKSLEVEADKIYNQSDYYLFNKCGIAGYLCNAIYHRETVVNNNITLREQREIGDYNEDLIFAVTYVSLMKNIVYTGYTDYLYDVRSDSLSHSFDRFYFPKYREKYVIWREFINKNGGDSEQLKTLSSNMLYHFLRAMQMVCDNNEGYERFKSIVSCEELGEILKIADTSSENSKIIKLINKKQSILLYLIFKLQKIKGRCTK